MKVEKSVTGKEKDTSGCRNMQISDGKKNASV